MGFTSLEKFEFRSKMRSQEKIREVLENHYPEEVISFLKSEGLMRQVRDYCIISEKLKPNKPENIVVTYLLSPDKSVFDILEEWQEFLSPPVRFQAI